MLLHLNQTQEHQGLLGEVVVPGEIESLRGCLISASTGPSGCAGASPGLWEDCRSHAARDPSPTPLEFLVVGCCPPCTALPHSQRRLKHKPRYKCFHVLALFFCLRRVPQLGSWEVTCRRSTMNGGGRRCVLRGVEDDHLAVDPWMDDLD